MNDNKYIRLFKKYEFNTGDILLFHGEDYFFSYVIEFFDKSPYSHIGIILKDPIYINPKLKGYYLLESGTETFPDAENNEKKFGVQISSLEKIFDDYTGKIYYRKLHCNRDNDFYTNLKKAHSIVHNRPYDLNPIDWIKAAFHIKTGNEQKKTTFWCSALTSFIYVMLNFLPNDIPWTIIAPIDFSQNKRSILKDKFKHCSLDDEILVLSNN